MATVGVKWKAPHMGPYLPIEVARVPYLFYSNFWQGWFHVRGSKAVLFDLE